MTPLKPWAKGPFELLLHAELHRRDGDDFDRRIAVISYDNSIEVAITTYLSLNPIQRANRQYARQQVEQWLYNYHTRLDFFMVEIQARGLTVVYEKAEIVWYHDVRNDQYHGGTATVPQWEQVEGIRKAAIWVFSVLFEVGDTELRLEAAVTSRLNQDVPARSGEYDALIDDTYGNCSIAGEEYATSEALYNIDPVAYSELGADLKQDKEEQVEATGGKVA
jgi:hypothetical protein